MIGYLDYMSTSSNQRLKNAFDQTVEGGGGGVLFFCISHDGLLELREDGLKEEDEIIVKRNEQL